jgi:hypothetical protein
LITGAALMWRRVRPLASPARIALLLLCFAAGAYPWIRHNVRSGGATFEETGHFSTEGVGRKITNFYNDLNGVSLLGYMIRDRVPESAQPAVPAGAAARAVVWLARTLKFPRRSFGGAVFVLCFLVALYLGGQARIAALMLAGGFTLMALTRGGGMWGYHAIVLWPLPQIVMALVLTPWRHRIACIIVGFCAVSALLVTNTHFAQLHLYSGSAIWSDAVYRLPATLERHLKTNPVGVIDWGVLEPMQLLGNGKLQLIQAIDRTEVKRGMIYAGHAPGLEVFPDASTRLTADALRAGCTLRVIDTVPDSLGVPIFQLQICE